MRLQSSSARCRNAVIHALENIRLPVHLSKIDLISAFSETFRVILPDTPSLVRQRSSGSHIDESEMDAIDALCSRLSDRQIVHRVSDRELMHGISEITRNIALLDDPSGQFRAVRPRLYTFNCSKCHLVGYSELRNLGILDLPVRSPSSFPQLKFVGVIYAFPCRSVRMELTALRPAGYWREL
jgi:hypothetical protein